MSRDLELMIKYGGGTSAGGNGYSARINAISLLRDIINQDGEANVFRAVDALDLDNLKESFDELFEFLYVYKRYRKINKKFNYTLSWDKEGFKLNESLFQTLDDLEKAYKNRAFL